MSHTKNSNFRRKNHLPPNNTFKSSCRRACGNIRLLGDFKSYWQSKSSHISIASVLLFWKFAHKLDFSQKKHDCWANFWLSWFCCNWSNVKTRKTTSVKVSRRWRTPLRYNPNVQEKGTMLIKFQKPRKTCFKQMFYGETPKTTSKNSINYDVNHSSLKVYSNQ